jgi:hypothetical protein
MSDSSIGSGNYDVIYQKDFQGGSGKLNIDSALKLQKNSDLAGISESFIAGKDFKLFLQPFQLKSDKLILVGMISKSSYQTKIKTIPVSFASSLIIIMLVLLTALPFVKIFFVSPKERISANDVLTMSLSIFLGTSFIVLILLYFYVSFITTQTFNKRLEDVSRKIATGFETELINADKQLSQFDKIFLKPEIANDQVLPSVQNLSNNKELESKADHLFIPGIYRNITRVFWIDKEGNTLAKWNPFNIHVPLSIVKGDAYFDSVIQKTAVKDSGPKEDLIVYPGKSNITGEFQVFISRRSRDTLSDPCNKGNSVNAQAIVLASFPNCSNYPILPPGFGFSLIDNNNYKVLINADIRRNLSENIIDETMDNERLKFCIRYKTKGPIDPVNIYGSEHVFMVTPLKGRELSLLVYYDKSAIFQNIFRLIHFTSESLFYLFGALTLCILATTGIPNRVNKLRFNLKELVWIRPSVRNVRSYRFTGAYWPALILSSLILLVFIVWITGDLRMVFYIVILLPFYTIWGFVSSRKKEAPQFGTRTGKIYHSFFKDIFLSGKAICFFIVVINFLFISFIFGETKVVRMSQLFWLIAFQVLALILFYRFYRNSFFLNNSQSNGNLSFTERKIIPLHTNDNYSRLYLVSLSWAVILIGIIPVTGIFMYAYQSEKIQFLKNKQLYLAKAYSDRALKVADAITDDYKRTALADAEFNKFVDSLKFINSQYLSDKDTIYKDSLSMRIRQKVNLPDATYITLLDSLFLITSNEYEHFSIRNNSEDINSWHFYQDKDKKDILLNYSRSGFDRKMDHAVVRSSYRPPVNLLFSPHYLALSIVLAGFVVFMLIFGYRLLDSAMHRVFLLKYYDKLPDDRLDLVEKFLSPVVRVLSGVENISPVDTLAFFQKERSLEFPSIKAQEEYILFMSMRLTNVYQKLWSALKAEERFFLYDFAIDGYANYKDAEMLTWLTEKKLLLYENSHFRLFALSFRNFLISKKGSIEILRLKNEYTVPGIWETMRVPVLVLIAVGGIFIFTTQEDFSHKLSAVLTSLGALIPLLLKLTERSGPSTSN